MATEGTQKKFIPAFDLPEKSARHVLVHWKLFGFVSIPILFVILFDLLGVGEESPTYGNPDPSNSEILAIFGLGMGFLVLFLIVTLIFYVMSVKLSLNVLTGKKSTVQDLVEAAKKYSLRMVGLGFLTAVIVLAGLILLIIPGLVLAVMLSLAPYIMIDKDKGIVDSLTESFNLVKDNSGPFLAAFGVYLLVNIALAIVGGFNPVLSAITSLVSILFILIPTIRYLELRGKKIPEPKA